MMRRWHMTAKQNEEQKQANLMARHTGMRVNQFFPDIEEITIDYTIEHRSAFEVMAESNRSIFKPNSEDFFIIPCVNRECSSIGFDLSSEIYKMYHNHQAEMSGEKRCEGQEAPDHPEQSCGSRISYTIKIRYK